jgi:RHS repeat-associated protein
LSDGQLSTRQLLSQAGVLTDSYTYDAFGEPLSSTGTTTNSYRYTGEQLDANTNFYYLRARYYDPAIGRFSVTDPLEGRINTPLSMHRYLYADADPVNKIDPSGKLGIAAVLVGAFVVLELIGALSTLGGVVGAFQSFARSRAEGRTDRFLYKPCGAWQFELGAGVGGGTAVIAEDPVIKLNNPPNQGRRFALSFRSVGLGFASDKEGDAIPFTTYKNQKRQLSAFIGEGIFLTGPEIKFPGYGYSLLGSQLMLPERSVVYQSAGGGTKVPSKLAELQLASITAVQFIGLDVSPGYVTSNGVRCAVPPDPK